MNHNDRQDLSAASLHHEAAEQEYFDMIEAMRRELDQYREKISAAGDATPGQRIYISKQVERIEILQQYQAATVELIECLSYWHDQARQLAVNAQLPEEVATLKRQRNYERQRADKLDRMLNVLGWTDRSRYMLTSGEGYKELVRQHSIAAARERWNF